MTTRVRIRNARAAFVELGTPDYFQGRKQRENDKKRWSNSFICGPQTQASLDGKTWGPAKAVIDEAIRIEAANKWGAKATAYLANILPDPKGCAFQDGNRKPDYEGYPGNWVLSAHRTEDKGRPLVLDGDKSQLYGHEDTEGKWVITNTPAEGKAGRIYSGCYVNGSVDLWAQDNTSGKAMRAELIGVQFAAKGDAFSGGAAPSPDEFEAIANGADADALA